MLHLHTFFGNSYQILIQGPMQPSNKSKKSHRLIPRVIYYFRPQYLLVTFDVFAHHIHLTIYSIKYRNRVLCISEATPNTKVKVPGRKKQKLVTFKSFQQIPTKGLLVEHKLQTNDCADISDYHKNIWCLHLGPEEKSRMTCRWQIEKRTRTEEQTTSSLNTGLARMSRVEAKSLPFSKEVNNSNYFSLRQGQSNSMASQKGRVLHSWREADGSAAISLVDKGDMIQEPPV